MVSLSILDLVRIPEGGSAKSALDRARDLAAAAENWGYKRYWVTEHHNMPGLASSATSLVLAHIAAGSKTIRVGAGGVMLPNHSPLLIAEQFGTLASLFPDRVDLGVGRADGSVDSPASIALRRQGAAERFPESVIELSGYFDEVRPDQRLQAVPAAGTKVPIWVLGTSTFGASLAAQLGMPYAFAAHLAPGQTIPAVQAYKARFKPSRFLEKPYLMVSLNAVAADTDEAAHRLWTTQKMSFTDLFRGSLGPSRTPIDDIDSYWNPGEKAQAEHMLSCSVVGSKETMKRGLAALLEQTGADELIVTGDIHNDTDRLRSFEIIAEAFKEMEDGVSVASKIAS